MKFSTTLPVLAIAAIGCTPGLASAQEKPAIVARAEQCLIRRADEVVAADHDLNSAANFLVSFACAEEVAGVVRYERNSALATMVTSVGRLAAAAKPNIPPALTAMSVNPETGELVLPAAKPGSAQDPMAMVSTMLQQFGSFTGQFAPDRLPASMRRLAGDLVFEASKRQAGKGR